jgi:uncharacterized Ntn-hydrolase superfamily protein
VRLEVPRACSTTRYPTLLDRRVRPGTNHLGVGVQSRAFAAGAIAPWARGGVIDARGTQAAAILVVAPMTDTDATTQRVIDIRIDEAADSFKVLREVTRTTSGMGGLS